jgi:hypothetical protein
MRTVIFMVNPDLRHGQSGTKLQGLSGRRYGSPSRWDGPRRGQVVELTLQQYAEAIDDIRRAWHQPRRTWVPHFVQKPSEEPGVTGIPFTDDLLEVLRRQFGGANAEETVSFMVKSVLGAAERPPAVVEFTAGYHLGRECKPLPDGASEPARAGHRAAQDEAGTLVDQEQAEILRKATEDKQQAEEVAKAADAEPENSLSAEDRALGLTNELPMVQQPSDSSDISPACPYFKLKHAAIAAGLNPEDFKGKGNAVLYAAIVEARQAKELATA